MPKKQKALWQELKLGRVEPWTLYLSEYQNPFLGACYAVMELSCWAKTPFDLVQTELEPLQQLYDASESAIDQMRSCSRLEVAFPLDRSYDHLYVMFIPRRQRKVRFAGLEFNEPAFMRAEKGLSYVPKGTPLDSRDALFAIRDAFRKNLDALYGVEVAT